MKLRLAFLAAAWLLSGKAAAGVLPVSFQWQSSGVLVAPRPEADGNILAFKDPTTVFFNGRWHLFVTTAASTGAWNMAYTSFADWSAAPAAQLQRLDVNPYLRGYHCAPQVFYFRPQKKWYLIFQSGQPQYSTADRVDDPKGWSKPTDFFAGVPEPLRSAKGGPTWLDFWVVCDGLFCHLFFTGDNGEVYRSQTPVQNFPKGFEPPVLAMRARKDDLFEGSSTYRLKGQDRYLTLVEAIGPGGRRYYRSFTATALDGTWSPQADTWDQPFAGQANVAFANGALPWTRDISHGELLRDGFDESMTVDPSALRFLYQGVDPASAPPEYFRLPYRLGLLSPISKLTQP